MDYRSVNPIPSGPLRRAADGTTQLLSLIFVTMPLAIGAGIAALARLPAVASLASLGAGGLTMASFYSEGLIVSTALFAGAILIGAAVVVTVPRVLRRLITPGRTYPLYGMARLGTASSGGSPTSNFTWN